MFSDLALSRRLERAEGYACAQFADARRHLFPSSRAEWMQYAGTYAIFDGADSPLTQSFGLGLFANLNPASLDQIERFFFVRDAPAAHEVSPFAGIATVELLCARRYRPIEISNVLYRGVEALAVEGNPSIHVRIIGPEESQLWSSVNARGWSDEHPELLEFLLPIGAIATQRFGSICFLGEIDGAPGAAAALCIHEGIALFAGSTTVPELRRRGLQAALLRARMQYAFDRGCDLAMMVAGAGSDSQRNAERNGFRIAYTRTKWRLAGRAQSFA